MQFLKFYFLGFCFLIFCGVVKFVGFVVCFVLFFLVVFVFGQIEFDFVVVEMVEMGVEVSDEMKVNEWKCKCLCRNKKVDWFLCKER